MTLFRKLKLTVICLLITNINSLALASNEHILDQQPTVVLSDSYSGEDSSSALPTLDLAGGIPVNSNVDSTRQPLNYVAGLQQSQKMNEKVAIRKDATTMPATIVAEKIYINDGNGNIYARGDVKITQGVVNVSGDRIDGNTEAKMIQVDGRVNYSDSLGVLTANAIRYNYDLATGKLQEFNGKYNEQFIVGEQAEIYPDHTIIRNGYITRCPAHVPDYRMQADLIEIWPNKEMIAYNAKWYIKETEVASQAVYRASLEKVEQQTYPSVGYNDTDGAWVSQPFNTQIGEQPVQFVLTYLTQYGLAYQANANIPIGNSGWSSSLQVGSYEDAQYNWIQKWPEYDLNSPTWTLGDGPITYSFNTVWGWWRQDPNFNKNVTVTTDSFHQFYNLYFNYGKPIPLPYDSNLYLGTGYNVTLESYNQSVVNAYAFDSSVWTTLSPNVDMLNGYHYTSSVSNLFNYNSITMNSEWDLGLYIEIDKLNSFSIYNRYNLQQASTYNTQYTYYRNLHCWILTVQYTNQLGSVQGNQQAQWSVDLSVINW